ncbi:MAG: hypothetical protein WEC82_04885 [Xanthobacteraceae bacterium]
MIAVDAAIMLGLFVYKVLYHNPGIEYHHLIIDYHFGFAKRAFVGALVSFALPVVPVWFVYALGGAVWLLALALFLKLFAKTFGFGAATAPLFAFLFGSPFFFKNFMQTIGYFDIYGCVIALIMLLIPARSFGYLAVGALGCVALILAHPLHMLLYVPTIGVIVVMRYYFARDLTAFSIVAGIVLTAAVAGVFVLSVFYGGMPAPMEQLFAYLRERTPDEANLARKTMEMWYRPISDDIGRTWREMPDHARRFPVYAALIALHWPVIRYFKQLVCALDNAGQRRLTVLGIAAVTVGYGIIGAVVFDYSRWFSSWAVCMVLIMHAVKMLPARDVAPPLADDKWNRVLGWIVTAIPRVGITKPF